MNASDRPADKPELISAMKEALASLYLKWAAEPEDIIGVFIKDYESTLQNLTRDNLKTDEIKKIKYCSKIYLQTSSFYSQQFLDKMYVVEKMLVDIVNE